MIFSVETKRNIFIITLLNFLPILGNNIVLYNVYKNTEMSISADNLYLAMPLCLIENFALTSFCVAIIKVIFRYWPRIVSFILNSITVLLYILFCLECLCLFKYNTLVGEGMVAAIVATNFREAWEYICLQLDVISMFAFLVFLSVSFLCYVLLVKISKKLLCRRRAWCFLLILGLISHALLWAGFANTAGYRVLPVRIIARSIHSVMLLNSAGKELDKQSIDVYESDGATKVIFLIGESTNRNHMGIYGYQRKTTPRLEMMIKDGQAIAFSDVVSPHATTMNVLKELLTTHNYESNIPWYKTEDLIELAKKTGYSTYWLSNQDSVGLYGNLTSIFADKCDYSKFTRQQKSIETVQNINTVDGDLIPIFDEFFKNDDSEQFFIMHIMGTHYLYNKRYPYQFNKFDDDTNESEREKTVNEYDNAVYYNDEFLYELFNQMKTNDALIIYVSDHGEDVYDNGSKAIGHLEEKVNHNMVEVPMIIIGTEKFIQNHQDIWRNIQANKDNPFMTDDIIHVIMGINKIKTNIYDSTRDITNKSYCVRKRMINGLDYDCYLKYKN